MRSGASGSGSSSSFHSGVEWPRACLGDLAGACPPRRLTEGVVWTLLCETRLALRKRADDGVPLLEALLDAFVLAGGDPTGVSGTGMS